MAVENQAIEGVVVVDVVVKVEIILVTVDVILAA